MIDTLIKENKTYNRLTRMFGNKPSEIFYDIEVYRNFFCCGFLVDDFFEFHYLLENDDDFILVDRALKSLGMLYKVYNLKTDANRFKMHFNIQKPKKKSDKNILNSYLDMEVEEIKPRDDWYFGYNILAYDIPMIDFVLKSIVDGKCQTTPESIRFKSDSIIKGRSYFDTLQYEKYGNHVDIAKLNDKLFQKGKLVTGLKTGVGLSGGTIKESRSNVTGFSEDIYDDTLYNFNDIKEMRDVVYRKSTLESMFQNRRELLNQFPELEQNNITVNSTTKNFVVNIIAPHKPIIDDPVVSMMFPAKHVADERGIEQFDVLEYFKEWYIKNVYLPVKEHNPKVAYEHFCKFLSIYGMYDAMRGKNWNTSKRHFNKYHIESFNRRDRDKLTEIYGTYIQFVDKYGNLSSTYVNFSIGGIHGAELNLELLNRDKEVIRGLKEKYKYISKIPKGIVPQGFLNIIKKQSRSKIKSGDRYIPQKLVHEIPEFYYKTQMVDEILDPEDYSPFCVDDKTKSEKLLERYKYTSVGEMIHQDFDGYYPMMMCLLGVFYDGNGRDKYKEVYDNRIMFKKMLNDLVGEEYDKINKKQDGLKLVCNSASGALDEQDYDTNIRANNKCIQMRNTGQICTYIIAQALCFEGAHIPSSNTDGIYVSNIDFETNKKIIKRELEKMLVTITPEKLFLISKDTNNRVEINVEKGKVKPKGSSVTCYNGANIINKPTKPTLVDRILTHYLKVDNSVNKEFDRNLARELLIEYKNTEDPTMFLRMASWIIRSVGGSVMVDDQNEIHEGTLRTFLVNEGRTLKQFKVTKQNVSANIDEYLNHLADDDMFGKPEDVAEVYRLNIQDRFIEKTLTALDYKDMYKGKYVDENGKKISIPILKSTKIENMNDDMQLIYYNESLLKMDSKKQQEIINNLNYDAYIDMIEDQFKNWKNPEIPPIKVA